MGGKKYFKGFTLYCSSYDRYAIFNLQGKYSKITFDLGAEDGSDMTSNYKSTVVFSEDDDVERTIYRKGNSLPKNYSLNVKGCYKFEIITNSEDWGRLGFGNVKLYY